MITSDAAHRDFRASAEALLDRPIITAARDRLLLEKVRRHAPALQGAFARLAGWQLQTHPEFARLIKTPARADPSHGLDWARGRQDYELLTWVLWYGESTGGRRFTISQMAEEIKQRTRSAAGAGGFDWVSREQRLTARRVLQGLEEMGVLHLHDGSVGEWADASGKRDALYGWGAAAWRLHVAIEPAKLQQLAEGLRPVGENSTGATDEVRLYRSLLLNQALFRRDDPQAFAHFHNPERRREVERNLTYLANWELEVTSAYARVLRPARSDDVVQTPIPILSAISHVVLCFCGLLRERQRAGRLIAAGDESFLIHESRIEQDIAELQARYGMNWGKQLREMPIRSLVRELLDEMTQWGLVRRGGGEGQYIVLPTAARLGAHYVGTSEDSEEILA